MTNSTLVCPIKMEYGWNFSISGLKMMMKSGLGKIFLKCVFKLLTFFGVLLTEACYCLQLYGTLFKSSFLEQEQYTFVTPIIRESSEIVNRGPLAWQILSGSKLIIFAHWSSENSKKHRYLASALPGPAPTGPLPHQATPHLNLISCITQCGLYMYCDLFTNIFNAVFLCTVNFFRVNFFHCCLFLLCTFSRHTMNFMQDSGMDQSLATY